MIQIIPAVIVKSFDELVARLKSVEPYVEAVQLDIMDGILVPNKTWGESADLEKLKTNLFLEAHLMVAEPAKAVGEWLESKVGRIIVHWEAINNFSDLMEKTHQADKEFGVALNPETPIEALEPYINNLDLVLLMSVNPGFAGQEFKKAVLEKIKALRQKYPTVKIGVDGGINLDNAKEVIAAGANYLAVGSAIFSSSNAGESIKSFKKSFI